MSGLWHKTWCETRARFGLAAAAILAGALLAAPLGESTATLFVLMVVLLGGGTLRQERALGTLGFTLALPVGRARLFWTRAAAGAAQVVALALIPPLAGGAPARAPGWIACGLALFAAALLVSSLVTQELVAWLVTYLAFFAYESIINVTPLRRIPALDLYRLMGDGNGVAAAAALAVAAALAILAALRPIDEAPARAGARRRAALRWQPGLAAALLHKAWRESRARFLVAAAALAGLVLTMVLFHAHFQALAGVPRYDTYIHGRLYGVGRAIFAVLAVLLALGGLRRESALGTASFSLALPVTRGAHVAARAAVGLAEVAFLAWLPAWLVPLASAAVGETLPSAPLASFALVWTAGGGAIFAVSFVIGCLLRNELVAFAVALVALRLAPRAGELLAGPAAPGSRLAALAVATLALTALAAWITRRARLA